MINQILERVDADLLVNRAATLAPNVLIALFILGMFLVLYRVSRRPIRSILERAGFHEALIHLLVNNVYHFTLVLFGLVMAADQVGVNVGAALAGLGVAGIAIGFAAQDSLANTIAGFIIFWDKPFTVGDWVSVSSQYGKVTEITMRSTRIRTNQNTYVVIPNKRIIDEVLVNHTTNGETRIDVPIGIAYKESIPEARRVILEAVSDLPGVDRHPAPDVVVEGLGGSSVDLLVRVWIDEASDERPVYFAVVEAAKLALDAAGIQIPYPHLQLFWDDVEERVVEKLGTLGGLGKSA